MRTNWLWPQLSLPWLRVPTSISLPAATPVAAASVVTAPTTHPRDATRAARRAATRAKTAATTAGARQRGAWHLLPLGHGCASTRGSTRASPGSPHGILGARHPLPPQAYKTMFAPAAMSSSTAPTWDQSGLIAAMNNLSKPYTQPLTSLIVGLPNRFDPLLPLSASAIALLPTLISEFLVV